MLTSLCENAGAIWAKGKRLWPRASAFGQRRSRYLLHKVLPKFWSTVKFAPQLFQPATNWRRPAKNFSRDKFTTAIRFCYNRYWNAPVQLSLRLNIVATTRNHYERRFKQRQKTKF